MADSSHNNNNINKDFDGTDTVVIGRLISETPSEEVECSEVKGVEDGGGEQGGGRRENEREDQGNNGGVEESEARGGENRREEDSRGEQGKDGRVEGEDGQDKQDEDGRGEPEDPQVIDEQRLQGYDKQTLQGPVELKQEEESEQEESEESDETDETDEISLLASTANSQTQMKQTVTPTPMTPTPTPMMPQRKISICLDGMLLLDAEQNINTASAETSLECHDSLGKTHNSLELEDTAG